MGAHERGISHSYVCVTCNAHVCATRACDMHTTARELLPTLVCVYVCRCVRGYVRACLRACLHVCVYAFVCVCMCDSTPW